MKQRKARVSVTIDKKIYEKAHELGINVSKVSENALVAVIDALEQANTQNSLELTKKVRSPGFEPGSSAWQGPTIVDWQAFEEYLKSKKYRGSGYRTKLSYATRYHGLLFRGELRRLGEFSPDKKANALKALSTLSKFLGCYSEFLRQKRDAGLTWAGKSADRLFIERYMKTEEADEVWNWVRQVKRVRMDLVPLLDYMSVSGLRMVEGVNSVNLAVQLCLAGKLDKYYNVEKNSFEHFRFEDIFIRRSKKAFVSFVPQSLVKEICGSHVLSNAPAVSKSLRKQGLKPRFRDIREAQGSFMVKYLKEVEIDFLHGRVTGNVFKTHYFNPATITDLQQRVFKGISEIQEKIKL